MTTILIFLAAVVSLSGALISLYIGLSIFHVSKAIKDKGLSVLSLAMIVFSLALLIEALVNIVTPISIHGHGRRPRELVSLLVNQGTLIAIPLYTVSYVLMAVSHYISGTPVKSIEENTATGKELVSLPLFVLVFIDYNIIDLFVLLIAAIIVLGRYGSARLPTVLFYITLGISHSLAIMLLLVDESWWLIPTSTLLRGIAPMILFFSSLIGREGK